MILIWLLVGHSLPHLNVPNSIKLPQIGRNFPAIYLRQAKSTSLLNHHAEWSFHVMFIALFFLLLPLSSLERRDTVSAVGWPANVTMHLSAGVNQCEKFRRGTGQGRRKSLKRLEPSQATNPSAAKCFAGICVWACSTHWGCKFNLIFQTGFLTNAFCYELFSVLNFQHVVKFDFHCAGFYFGWRLGAESDKAYDSSEFVLIGW